MPQKLGRAIGIITSEPRPVPVMTGISARTVVVVVIRHGRTRRLPASTTWARMSGMPLTGLRAKTWLRYVVMTTPSSVAMPNRAMKPIQTAVLRL